MGLADHPLGPANNHGLVSCKQLAHQLANGLVWLIIISSCMQQPVTKVARIHLGEYT
jgi:hypothetical protein